LLGEDDLGRCAGIGKRNSTLVERFFQTCAEFSQHAKLRGGFGLNDHPNVNAVGVELLDAPNLGAFHNLA